MSKQIVIIGNIGSGKSTLLSNVSTLNLPRTQLLLADELFQANPFFPLSKSHSERWSFTNDLWFLIERVKLVQKSLDSENTEQLIIDSSVWMSYVYAKAHFYQGAINQDELDLFETVFDRLIATLPLPSLVICLEATNEVLSQRIKQRNRDFEQTDYDEYLASISVGLAALEEKLSELKIPLRKIDTATLSPEAVLQQVEDAVN